MTDRTWSAVQVRGRRRWTTRTSPPGALVSWTRPAEGESVLTAGDAIVCGVEDDAPLRASLTHRLRRVMHLVERRYLFLRAFRTVVGMACKTRAVSRIPLACRATLMICSVMWGDWPGKASSSR